MDGEDLEKIDKRLESIREVIDKNRYPTTNDDGEKRYTMSLDKNQFRLLERVINDRIHKVMRIKNINSNLENDEDINIKEMSFSFDVVDEDVKLMCSVETDLVEDDKTVIKYSRDVSDEDEERAELICDDIIGVMERVLKNLEIGLGG